MEGLTKIPMEAISLMPTRMIILMEGNQIDLEVEIKHSKIELKLESKLLLLVKNSQLRKFIKRQNIKPQNSKNLNKTYLIHSGNSIILEVCSVELWE